MIALLAVLERGVVLGGSCSAPRPSGTCPANPYLSRQPGNHAAYAEEILNPGIDRMVEAGIRRRPGYEETQPTGELGRTQAQ
ncbi:hypothetical protein [Kitasatospora sp. NPDC005856]|uniref:hypothetical protein n=1 Tax=Kitasatospora sp. NPDC005856 TaxID=3154566 RepID=UPI0033D37D82